MIRRLLTAAAAVVCAAALMTACTPTSAPTPTPTFNGRAQAFAAAETTYRAYIDALNKVDLGDPATFEGLYIWETGDRLANDKKALTGYHADHAVMSGETIVSLLTGRNIDADYTSVKLNACVNVSSVQIRDPSGKSLVSVDRQDIQSVTITVTRSTSTKTGFAVASVSGRTGTPLC